MIWLDKTSPVVESELSILYKLQEEVIKKGFGYFRSGFKTKGTEIMLSCPVHKHGQERRPSSSITTVDKHRYDGSLIPAGTFHCFACGTIMKFSEFVSYCLGYYDDGLMGEKWLRENFTIGFVEGQNAFMPLPSREQQLPNSKVYVQEEELEKYRVYHDYMFKRGLTEDIIEAYDVGFDPYFRLSDKSMYTPCITFPVRDVDGNVIFVARRATNSKLFHYPNEADKPVYGIYELYRDNEIKGNPGAVVQDVTVCESIFNTLTCVKWGYPSVALLGTGSHTQYDVIDRLPCNKLYLCLDPDAAGNSGTERMLRNLKRSNVYVVDLPKGKDVNDVSFDVFEQCFKRATISFMWKKSYFSEY